MCVRMCVCTVGMYPVCVSCLRSALNDGKCVCACVCTVGMYPVFVSCLRRALHDGKCVRGTHLEIA